ncbi:hypothetical protein PROFUN_06187 [Planoprotostelium fungivorum]|uniref:Uncharacterized protein n=1 Tax=Planoprotostelium fungivorum TaxID=1890364 RepID=A0A2P6MYY4_9EUKA|nr:hypothetical protein PROFUN_06187 [Planoprotostelium fungivorum]
MILRTLCLSLLLCIAIVRSIDECEVYVDSQSGSDVATCGQKQQPCRSIPYNSTNVCVSSGQYSVTDRLPSVMRDWQPDGGTETELPQITCLNDVEISCDRQPSLNWNRLEFRKCNMEIYPTNVSVSSINGCLLNDTMLSVAITPPPVSSVESSSSSLTRFIGNHLLGSSSFIYRDETSNSLQEIINNTYESTPTFHQRPNAPTISLIWIRSTASDDSKRRLLLEDNALPSVTLITNTRDLPNTRIAKNRFDTCQVYMYTSGLSYYAHLEPTIEGNVITSLLVEKTGILMNATSLVVRYNIIQNMNEGTLPVGVKDTITDNNMTLLIYEIINHHPLALGHMNITRNVLSRAEVAVDFTSYAELFLVDNVWMGPSVIFTKQPALHISQIHHCSLHLSNSSMDGYPEGGLWISEAFLSEVHVESLRVSGSGRGGVLIFAEKSHIYLDSVTLSDNDSPTVGGGISILDRKYNSNDSSVIIRNTRMMNNRSPHGSAVFISAGSIKMENVSIIVEDDIDQPLVDHSVVVLNGRFVQEDVSLSCAEERYLASSNASSSLVWSCRPCATGTYFLGRGEMVEDVEKGNKCTRCPEKGAECVDGKTPQAKPNYWCGKNSLQQLICHNCPSGYCNETAHLWNSSCIGHRSGELCGGCADGYTLGFLTSACLPVDHCRHEWIGLLSIIPFVYVAVLLFVPIGDGAVWKSMSYFVQTVPLLLKQERQNSIISMFSSLFTTPTNMGSSSLGFCIGQMDYIEREFISLYVPAGTVILFLFGCLCILLYHKMGCTMPRRKIMFLTQALNKRSMLSRCTTGLVTGFLLMYSGLIASYLKLYFCIEIEPGRWVMYNAGTERCDQWWRTPFVSVASILLLPFPLLLLFIRSRLRGTERETGRDVLIVLDGCYRQSTKYWESVYMVRRVVIAVAYVFITDEQWSATVMRFLLLTALFLHLFFTPFITVAGQTLETMCLLSLCFLTVLNGQLEERYSHAFLVIIALPFLASLIIMIHKLWMKRKKKYTRYEPLVTSEEL